MKTNNFNSVQLSMEALKQVIGGAPGSLVISTISNNSTQFLSNNSSGLFAASSTLRNSKNSETESWKSRGASWQREHEKSKAEKQDSKSPTDE